MFEQVMDSIRAVMPDSIVSLLPKLLAAIIVMLVFWGFWRLLVRGIGYLAERAELDATLRRFVETLTQYVVVTLALLTALAQFGVDVGAVLTSLGVVGLTIGFAAKDALSNVISGLFILWDRPFVIGDLVEINGFYGRVDNITLRSTRVVTIDGKMLAIPNTTVVNSTVASYTNFPTIRVDVAATIGTGEDLARVRKIYLDMVSKNEVFLVKPPPQMVVTALNDYNVAVEFRAWIQDERQHIRIRFALREAIFNKLVAEGVEMPLERTEIVSIPYQPKVESAPEMPSQTEPADSPAELGESVESS